MNIGISSFALAATVLIGVASMSLAMGGGESISQVGSDSFSFVSGNEIFSGTGFNGSLTPPINPAEFIRTNNRPHSNPQSGATGHGVFNITCSAGAVDYYGDRSERIAVYAVADGEVSAARMTYYSTRYGAGGSILELRHSGEPRCSSYAHIAITDELIQEIKKYNPSFGRRDSSFTEIPASVHITVTAGQKIGEIDNSIRGFTPHLHFQLDGANESQLKAAMNALKGGN